MMRDAPELLVERVLRPPGAVELVVRPLPLLENGGSFAAVERLPLIFSARTFLKLCYTTHLPVPSSYCPVMEFLVSV